MKKDYELNAEVRKILVENRVDLDTLYYKVVGGILLMEGIMKKQGGDMTSIAPTILDKMEKQLNMIHELDRIRWRLENFVKMDGDWKHMINKLLERKRRTIKFDPSLIKKMLTGDTSKSSARPKVIK